MRTAFEREGDVRSVDLLVAFATLWRERASGVVVFSRPGQSTRFEISKGEFVAVSSSDDSFDTAEILRRAEKLSAEALEDGRIPAGSDRARYLRDLGLLSDRDWRWGEKLRVVEILSDLVHWLDGSYECDPTEVSEASDFRIGIHRVVLELYLRSSDREFIHHSLGAPDAALERGADFDERFASLGLTPDALAVAAAIDGRATAADISRRTPPDPFSVEKLLAALATLGLVRPEYALEEALTPEPAPPEPEPTTPPPEPRPEPPAPPVEEPDLLEIPVPVEPSEPESGLDLWQDSSAEPMDQPLVVVKPPDFSVSSRRRISPVWLPLLLAAAVGALLLFRTREPSAPSRASHAVSPTGLAAATPAPLSTRTAAALPALPTLAPETPVVAPTPTPVLEPSPRSTTPVVRSTPAAPRAARTRGAWLALAERDHRRLVSDHRTRFSIQLELVCELPSLEEAWDYDRQGAMWLLTASHQGRTCFRVFWGRHGSLEQARAAKSSVPGFFFTPTNRPVVVSTSGALLR